MPHTKQPMTVEELDRVRCRIRPFPLPTEVVPLDTCSFDDIPESVLLTTPPHLIVHMQRTAAQGGMQVVSPRQTPMSCLMHRTASERRMIGDHIVGSTADLDDTWPTMDDTDFSDLLPDEPLPDRTADPAHRMRTKTQPITSATHMLSDPILSCLVKGRAVADILDRDDVQGDAKALLSLLADAWGVEESDLSDLDAFSLGYEGELQRHAIRVDDVYPTMHAPVHQRLSISVGSNEITKDNLPAGTGMDWRRMRVLCEAVFSMCMSIEGIPLKAIRATPPPGDMTAPGNRPNILAFMPSACSAWCHSADTFSINPVLEKRGRKQRSIPREVMSALTGYLSIVKPMSYAMSKGYKAPAKTSHLIEDDTPSDEALQATYHIVTRGTVTGGARGRTASAAVRSYIFEVIDNMPPHESTRLSRYIQIAKAEVRTHLSLFDVPDDMIDELAKKFLVMGDLIRLRVSAEAKLRGHDIEEWWGDITAQAALRYREMKEGTMGWARVAMYLLFKQPTDKWRKLASAINFDVMRHAAYSSVGAVSLPAEEGSAARIESAARHVVTAMTRTYGGHYIGVADVGRAMANHLDRKNKPQSAEKMRQAAYLWSLRARVFRATNVTLVPPDTERKNPNHYLARGKTVAINLAPAPYRMYAAYRVSLLQSEYVPIRIKNMFPDKIDGRISQIFKSVKVPIIPSATTELTKYLVNPSLLGADMEKSWRELVTDMEMVLATYEVSTKREPAPTATQMASSDTSFLLDQTVEEDPSGKKDYYTTLALMHPAERDYIEDILDGMTPEIRDMVEEEDFVDGKELIRRVHAIRAEIAAGEGVDAEAVR